MNNININNNFNNIDDKILLSRNINISKFNINYNYNNKYIDK
jgi:hypothetical protein